MKNPDKYYYYEEVLDVEDCSDFELDSNKQLFLKQALIQSIVSIIETTSEQKLKYQKRGVKYSETEVFLNNSTSTSSAILFNPKFTFCNSSSNRISVIISIEKESFHELALGYFRSLLSRSEQNLNSNQKIFERQPNYDFTEEMIGLDSQLNQLDSYYTLVIALIGDSKIIDRFIEFERNYYAFSTKVNSLGNSLKLSESLNQQNRFVESYKVLNPLKRSYPDNPLLREAVRNYNQQIRTARSEKIKDLKKNSISFNHFSFELGMNSALLNNYKGSSGLDNYNNNEPLDRIYPYLEIKFISNDREHKFGLGGYFRYNFSNALFVITDREYFFPFSSSYSELGITANYFFLEDKSKRSNTAFTLSLGKFLEVFQSEEGSRLNFWNLSPGFKTYLQNKTNKSNATSLVLRMNLVLGGNQYSYSNFSLGISRDLKITRKLSERNKELISELFKIID